jgi:hypothetical protein
MLPILLACADANARRRGALEQAIEEAREYRRQASSRIVVPDGAGGALPGGGICCFYWLEGCSAALDPLEPLASGSR